ncbi:PRC-barrel domain-containing protein [Telmatospirillum sp.]|uniref:PRC-barrel domain-containing protein n=1 Tax=Telmatospirillum sp. TaxID=2079197 RepID=UPI00283C8F78|nr:PRC-barrel domain-containing protein [Telmatospirillum sp.]MDR3438141.1 PRC-barrel domain-containing protein [Telmatospirillum sp.]
MLLVGSALKGYATEASDGRLGKVSDFLFDDETWMIRWLVVDTGAWLAGRKVLLHPSAIGHIDNVRQTLALALTKAQVEGSPLISRDQPISSQMESHLFGYYGCDHDWESNYFGTGANGSPLASQPYFGAPSPEDIRVDPHPEKEDQHLHSMTSVTGYHIHGTDGDIGHVESFLIDAASWGIRYFVVDTKNWWLGQHVLVSPYAVQKIRWSDRQIRLDVTRDQVKSCPPWDPIHTTDQTYEKKLHSHYGWPGYGF